MADFNAVSAGEAGKGMSLGALICGILSLVGTFCCGFGIGPVVGIVAIILGIVANCQMKKAGDFTNKSKALTGLIMGIVGVVLGIITTIISIILVIAAAAGDM